MEKALRRGLQGYPLYFLLWTVLGLFYFSQGLTQRLVSHDPTPWWHSLVAWLLGACAWALLTPAVLWLGRRYPIERRNWARPIALHLLLSAGFSAFELILESAMYSRLRLFPTTQAFAAAVPQLLARGFQGGVFDYFLILGVQRAALYYHRYQERSREALKLELRASELQSQLVGAQLDALKMQLQPHFLFNTLNAIAVLVRQQKSDGAEEMLGYLGDLLRHVLDDADASEVPLRRELEYVQIYLAIERVRFADRLRVTISADPAAREVSVPQLILQPIVENAIRHGIERSSSAGRILITASKIDGAVLLRVQDDGPGLLAGESCDGWGIGLANTRARLRQHYGDDAGLSIENCDQGGVAVTMSIPARDSGTEEDVSAYASDSSDRGR
jgi:two-component system, LytTR family, sensor kinase